VDEVAASGCACSAAYAAELERELQQEGTDTATFVQGALSVLQAACRAEADCPEDAGAGR
jgi:hypothetical protein